MKKNQDSCPYCHVFRALWLNTRFIIILNSPKGVQIHPGVKRQKAEWKQRFPWIHFSAVDPVYFTTSCYIVSSSGGTRSSNYISMLNRGAGEGQWPQSLLFHLILFFSKHMRACAHTHWEVNVWGLRSSFRSNKEGWGAGRAAISCTWSCLVFFSKIYREREEIISTTTMHKKKNT